MVTRNRPEATKKDSLKKLFFLNINLFENCYKETARMPFIPHHYIHRPRPQRQQLKKPKKANNRVVTKQFLQERIDFVTKLGYSKQKWVEFCEVMLGNNLTVFLYEARETVSKYVTVTDGKKSFKVRFSNHKPIAHRQERGDCNFFVGISHGQTTTTTQAIIATLRFFEILPV